MMRPTIIFVIITITIARTDVLHSPRIRRAVTKCLRYDQECDDVADCEL